MSKTMQQEKNGLQKTFESFSLEAYNDNPDSSKRLSVFSDIPQEKLAKGTGGEAIKCDDQYIAILTVNVNRSFDGSVCWKTEKKEIENRTQAELIQRQDDLPTIALVLESPHKSEFFNALTNMQPPTPPYPAMGHTGDQIIKYFPSVLLKYILQKSVENDAITRTVRDIENGDYRLVLVNVIEYQCSLGAKTKKYRDAVFSKCFDDQAFKDDFVNRLKGYTPSIIINCCTRGEKESSDFNSQVQSLISEKFHSALKLNGYHPSCPLFCIGFKKVD